MIVVIKCNHFKVGLRLFRLPGLRVRFGGSSPFSFQNNLRLFISIFTIPSDVFTLVLIVSSFLTTSMYLGVFNRKMDPLILNNNFRARTFRHRRTSFPTPSIIRRNRRMNLSNR
ncbi:hypothetical protein HanRHA438_Chr15g0728341 [Helianthus annuus]|nr:hypothetical protein HanRHA438_Chr15g0728341 [Helianthus annuus]